MFRVLHLFSGETLNRIRVWRLPLFRWIFPAFFNKVLLDRVSSFDRARRQRKSRKAAAAKAKAAARVGRYSLFLSLSLLFERRRKNWNFVWVRLLSLPAGKTFWEVYFSLISLVRPSVRPSEQQKKKKNKKKNWERERERERRARKKWRPRSSSTFANSSALRITSSCFTV